MTSPNIELITNIKDYKGRLLIPLWEQRHALQI